MTETIASKRISKNAAPASQISGGFLLGIDLAAESLALAALCFAGPLAAAQGLGTFVFLVATTIAALITSRLSRIPGAISTVQDAAIAVLAAGMALAAKDAVETAGVNAAILAAFCVMGLSTLLSGVALYALGQFRLARYARYLPFPVSCGFLAAAGLLLLISAIEIALDASFAQNPLEFFKRIISQEAALVLAPSVLLALFLRLILARIENAWAFALTLFIAGGMFWLDRKSVV